MSAPDAVDGSHPTPSHRAKLVVFINHRETGAAMCEVITIGVDLAKRVFRVHGVDGEGGVDSRQQLRRAQMFSFFKKQPPCLVHPARPSAKPPGFHEQLRLELRIIC